MKTVINFFNNIRNKRYSLEDIRYLVGCMFVFFLPFERFFSELSLILLVILAIIDLTLEKIKLIPKSIWIFQLVFLISLSGLFYTETELMKAGGFQIEKQMALFIFPIIMPLSFSLTKQRVTLFLRVLTISCALSLLYLLINNFIISGYSYQELIQSSSSFNHSFSAPLNIHASYYASFICLSAFYILDKYRTHKKFYLLLILLLLSFGLFILAARVILIIFFIVAITHYLFYSKGIKQYIFALGLVALLAIIIFKVSPYISQRFGEDLLTDIGLSISGEEKEPRIDRWHASIDLISESPIIGHGTGSEVHLLKEKYWNRGLILSFYQGFNAHNQFLSILIKHGMVGVVLFSFSLFYFIRIAIRNKSFLYFSFLLLILVFFML